MCHREHTGNKNGGAMTQEQSKSRTRCILAVTMLAVTASVIAAMPSAEATTYDVIEKFGKRVSVSRETTTRWTENCFVRRLKAGSPWCSNVLADTETGDKLSFNELVSFNGVGLRRC